MSRAKIMRYSTLLKKVDKSKIEFLIHVHDSADLDEIADMLGVENSEEHHITILRLITTGIISLLGHNAVSESWSTHGGSFSPKTLCRVRHLPNMLIFQRLHKDDLVNGLHS